MLLYNIMRVLHSFEEAFEIGKPYITRDRFYKEEIYDILPAILDRQPDPVPKEALLPLWKMTEEALANTLRYIFEKLHHNCYLLCVKKNKPIMYKIEHSTTAPTFDDIIQQNLNILDFNPMIDESQRKYIRNLVSKPVRVMQCIVKKYDKTTDLPAENEYMELLNQMLLPDGVYLMNLTDAVILHSKGKEPFQMVTKNVLMEPKYRYTSHIPILSMSGQKKYNDIAIPNYDDVMFVLDKRRELQTHSFLVNWDDKTIEKAVFRGGSTGCGYTTETNMRMKLADMESPYIDAKLTSKSRTIDTKSVKFDPLYLLGMMNTKIKSATKFMTMIDQSKYKYIIHIDGNVNAYRLLTSMLTGSLILRVDSPYTSWVDHLLKPNEHYILIKPDLSDLVDKIKWCIKHDNKSRQIANNGYEFASKTLTLKYVKSAFEKIFWTVSPLPPKPRSPEGTPPNWKPLSPEGFPPHSPEGFPPHSPEGFPPHSPEGFPPHSPEGPPPRSPEGLPPLTPEDFPLKKSSSLIDMPEKAKKCPKGYLSHTVNGKKMCKRKTQKNKSS
jgi:hypothetical protein